MFAGTDAYLTNDEGSSARPRSSAAADPIEVPAYVSPIAVAFNLAGVDSLNLGEDDRQHLHRHHHQVERRGDRRRELRRQAARHGHLDVHRSDDSGTTINFTDYLSKAGNGAWSDEADGLWPRSLKSGQGLEGTSGVIGGMTDTEGAIGYADDCAVKATDLGVVSIKVGSDYNAPSAEGAAQGRSPTRPRRRGSARRRHGDRHRPHDHRRRAPTRCCWRRT